MPVEFPMFPLGTVLLPHMPLPLRIFEERYLVMLAEVLQDEPSQFGVVLIERGQEAGSEQSRFSLGTAARIGELQPDDGALGMLTQGDRRFRVTEWLPDKPYPRALVEWLDDLEWDDGLQPLLDRTEEGVRRVLQRASNYADQTWPANVELDDEPQHRAWQLAGIAPLAQLDQLKLLGSASYRELLESLLEETLAVEVTLGWLES